jgi:hypothetical protein
MINDRYWKPSGEETAIFFPVAGKIKLKLSAQHGLYIITARASQPQLINLPCHYAYSLHRRNSPSRHKVSPRSDICHDEDPPCAMGTYVSKMLPVFSWSKISASRPGYPSQKVFITPLEVELVRYLWAEIVLPHADTSQQIDMPFVNASNNVREWIFKSSVPFRLACSKLEVVRKVNNLNRITSNSQASPRNPDI